MVILTGNLPGVDVGDGCGGDALGHGGDTGDLQGVDAGDGCGGDALGHGW